MLSETLSEGLAAYGIGEKVRALRLKKKMGLVELGQHTGLSPAMLSKIERGRLFPTLPTLLRVALVFSVGLEWFFRTDPERSRVAVVRRSGVRRAKRVSAAFRAPRVRQRPSSGLADRPRRHQQEPRVLDRAPSRIPRRGSGIRPAPRRRP